MEEQLGDSHRAVLDPATIAAIHELAKRENYIYNKEADQRSVGDFSVADVKHLIREIIRDEMRFGDLPLLNRERSKRVSRTILVAILFLVVLSAYYFYTRISDFSIISVGDKILVKRSIGFEERRFRMRSIDNRWNLCSDTDEIIGCTPVFTPFEARFDSRSNFIFVGGDSVFWVDNDRVGVRKMRFQEGEWWFEDENSLEEWTSFDSHFQLGFDAQEYEKERNRP